MRADFHLHTTMSDGQATPELLVWKASARNLDLIAVTDHDTTAGCAAAIAEGHELGVKVLAGVELSANVALPSRQGERRDTLGIHLICLGFDATHPALQAVLTRIRDSRVKATRATLDALALAGYGADLATDALAAGDRSVCRPHVAQALVAAGRARNKAEAFDKFLSGEAYRSHYDLPSAQEAIAVVHAAGGVAIYAHPYIEDVDEVAPLLKEAGLDGIEVWRASWPKSPRPLYIAEVAQRLDLMPSGGSDWHGTGLSFGEFALTQEAAPKLVGRLA